MKIRFWDRLILFLGALLTIAAGAFLAVCGLQFAGELGKALPLPARVGCIAGGVLLVAFAVYLLLFPRKCAAGRHSFIVQQTDNGELRIAVKAIESLVQKCVDMHEEIDLNSMRIRNAREGVTVDMSISLANNISIPLAVASLQKQIKQYLVASSGIEVKEVRVSVDTTSGEAEPIPDSPYLVQEQEQEKQEKPVQEQPKAKRPMHQRIFGRQEQEAIVPEPPKAEEAPDTAPAQEEAPAEAAPEAAAGAESTPAAEIPAAEEAPAAEETSAVEETSAAADQPLDAPEEEAEKEDLQ